MKGIIRQSLSQIRDKIMGSTLLSGSNGSTSSYSNVSFDSILHGSIQNNSSGFINISQSTTISQPGYEASSGYKDFVKHNILDEPVDKTKKNSELNKKKTIVKKELEYSGIQELNKLKAKGLQYSSMQKLNKIKDELLKHENGKIITDKEFYNSKALSIDDIDRILKEKKSPFVNRLYQGKTAGELIHDVVNNAGTTNAGSNKLNPAMILAIMGAESSFGTNPKNVKENPFNIKINGSFDYVTRFEDSLNIAVNTMYNWAQNRPENSNESLFEYAGKHYCEDSKVKWKPNVEKYYQEFISQNKTINSDLKEILEDMPPEKILMQMGINNYANNFGNLDMLNNNTSGLF